MTRGSRRRNRDEEDVPRSSRYVDDTDDVDVVEEDEEDEEDEAPRRSRRGSSRPPGRSRDEDKDSRRPGGRSRNRQAFDEGAAEGRGRRRSGSESSRRAVEDGWGAVDKLKAEGGFNENLKVPADDEIVIKFLDDKPYAGYREHWVQETKAKRKTYTCLGATECPLCLVLDHQASSRILFNVVDMSGTEPTVKTWAMGTKLAEKIRALGEKPRTKPINREDRYWVVSKSGKGTSTEYNLEPITDEDLEDWDIESLDADELAELMELRASKEDIRWDSVEELEELAEEVL